MEPMAVLSALTLVNKVHAQHTEFGHLLQLTLSDPGKIHIKQSRTQYKKGKL